MLSSKGYELDEKLFSDKMLEDEYVTWTLLFNRDFGAGFTLDFLYVNNEGTMLLGDVWPPGVNVYRLDRFNTLTPTANYNLYATYIRWSHTHKYILGYTSPGWPDIVIYRDGLPIWTRSPLLDNLLIDTIMAQCISPNGKFIALIARNTATAEWRWVMIYEGS